MRRFKKQTGIDLRSADPKDIETQVSLIWAGIAHKYPGMTVDDVAELIDMSNYREINEFVEKQSQEADVKNP